MIRKATIKNTILPATVFLCMSYSGQVNAQTAETSRPNILFAISDDQSFPHASAYGATAISTPAFDALAKEGVLFVNAFAAAPQCSPSRAAILTGRNIWQLEEAGTHGSLFPKKFQVFTDALGNSGYSVGYTGKAWAPGNWKQSGWERNPVGPEFNSNVLDDVPYDGIKNVDYSANFREFINAKENSKPFFFWFGCHEPHREFEYGSGVKSGKSLSDATVPDFLPDVELVQNEILDYNVEIEWFDKHLGEMISFLKEIGEFENTIIVITSDNGMAFPHAKANLYEFGTHVPLLISGKKFFRGDRTVDDLVSLIDLAPTFLELANVPLFEGITGKSLLPLLTGTLAEKNSGHRDYVFTGRERHTHARPDNLGYPCRAVRTKDFLYIRNFKADRWPAGDPSNNEIPDHVESKDIKPIGLGYSDIDDSPTKELMINNSSLFSELFQKAFAKRPAEELYDIKNDPFCLVNISDDEQFSEVKSHLKMVLENELKRLGDPRVSGYGDIFESYPRFGLMRNFPGFKERGEYNKKYMIKQE